MAGKTETPFAKDFGYLRPFLGRIEEHARTLDGPRGERLRALLEGQAERWDEIAALLAGAEPRPRPASPPAAGASEAPPPAGAAPVAVPPDAMARGGSANLTVGSLRGDRRRSS